MIIYTQADKLSKVTVTAILVSEQNTFNRRAKSKKQEQTERDSQERAYILLTSPPPPPPPLLCASFSVAPDVDSKTGQQVHFSYFNTISTFQFHTFLNQIKLKRKIFLN